MTGGACTHRGRVVGSGPQDGRWASWDCPLSRPSPPAAPLTVLPAATGLPRPPSCPAPTLFPPPVQTPWRGPRTRAHTQLREDRSGLVLCVPSPPIQIPGAAPLSLGWSFASCPPAAADPAAPHVRTNLRPTPPDARPWDSELVRGRGWSQAGDVTSQASPHLWEGPRAPPRAAPSVGLVPPLHSTTQARRPCRVVRPVGGCHRHQRPTRDCGATGRECLWHLSWLCRVHTGLGGPGGWDCRTLCCWQEARGSSSQHQSHVSRERALFTRPHPNNQHPHAMELPLYAKSWEHGISQFLSCIKGIPLKCSIY